MNGSVFRLLALAAFVFVAQFAVLNRIELFGVHPDAMLLAAVYVGLRADSNRGAVVGFVAGLSSDVFLPTPLGINALSYAVAGFVAGQLAKETNSVAWVESLLALVACAVGAFMVLLISGIIDVRSVSPLRQIWFVVAVSVINAAMVPVVTQGRLLIGRRRSHKAWA